MATTPAAACPARAMLVGDVQAAQVVFAGGTLGAQDVDHRCAAGGLVPDKTRPAPVLQMAGECA